jgi:AcrR family transcriptional regulator
MNHNQNMNRRSTSEPAPQTLRERLRSTTIETILNAAEEVFADKGLHAAHMSEIASRAGVSVGTLYNHFEDREALLTGLLEARRAELLAQLDEVLRAASGRPAIERLRGMVETMLVHKSRHRKFMQILLQGEIGRYANTFPSASHMPGATLHEIHGRVEQVVRQGIKDGSLRTDIEAVAPMILMGMVRSIAIRDALKKSDGGDPIADAAQLFDFFLKGAGASNHGSLG